MWIDPLVEEIHQVRQAHAARFNYDLHAILNDFRQRQSQSGKTVVSFAKGRPQSSEFKETSTTATRTIPDRD